MLTANASEGAGGRWLPRSDWFQHLRRPLEIFSVVMTILVSVLASLIAIVAVASRMSSAGQYTVFGRPVLSVASGSMAPAIRTGDLIIDTPVTLANASDLRVGQIISFHASVGSQTIITHRIVAVIDRKGIEYYRTKGDANRAADAAPVPASDVLGVVQHDIAGGSYILGALHRPLVLGLLFASVLLFFLTGPLFRMSRRLETAQGAEPSRHRKTRDIPW
jgi:signal peptidase